MRLFEDARMRHIHIYGTSNLIRGAVCGGGGEPDDGDGLVVGLLLDLYVIVYNDETYCRKFQCSLLRSAVEFGLSKGRVGGRDAVDGMLF